MKISFFISLEKFVSINYSKITASLTTNMAINLAANITKNLIETAEIKQPGLVIFVFGNFYYIKLLRI